jgi:hypothetical protein
MNIKSILFLLILILTKNIYAQNLTLIKKNKFTSCEEIKYYGSYKGRGEYTLYEENQNPYKKYCEIEKLAFKQENFGSLAASDLKEMSETNHDKIKIYHSEDLYYVFEQKVINDRNLLDTLEAKEIVNKNNVYVGRYILIVSSSKTSGIVTSDIKSGWCSPINGRYNGSCFNNSKGIGDWEIILSY